MEHKSLFEQQNKIEPQKFFLIGILALGVIVIAGLIWAIFATPDQAPSGKNLYAGNWNDLDDPSFGSTSTKVVVRLFGDFQCPACKAAEEGITYARRTYGDRVRFVWKDFPLMQVHANAFAGANAARCAEAQGKFWEYHDALYRNQLAWSNQRDPTLSLREYAQELGVNVAAFTSCFEQQTYRKKILDDVTEGTKNSVDATPTVFVNSQKIVGVIQPADWDRELKAALGP